MRKKEEIKKIVNNIFPDEPGREKKKIIDHIFRNETRLEWWNRRVAKKAIEPLIPDVVRGVKILTSASEGGKTRMIVIAQKHAYWQDMADQIWEKHPTWAKWRVSQEIENRLSDDNELRAKADTISRKIKKNS